MLTDLDLVQACAASYGGSAPTWGTDVTHVYLSQAKGCNIVCFEGTKDIQEWLIDFEAVPADARGFDHESLGFVHLGWWTDVSSVADEIIAALKTMQGPLACTGHSKGAGEALIFAAYAKTFGITWQRVSTFGTPHPGALNSLVTSADGCDYWNCDIPHDWVPTVPFYLSRPRPLTVVNAPLPQYNNPDWSAAKMESHHIQNYEAAMGLLFP